MTMKAIWSGTIKFGLVYIPVNMVPAVKSDELCFHLLHHKDFGRISHERVCNKCGLAVDYKDIVRGYEYEKDRYVVVSDQDFEKVYPQASKNIQLLDFVDLKEIDPLLFEKPYYLLPEDDFEGPYALLREALKRTQKVGIGELVMYTREHLAAIRPNDSALMLNLLHYADELASPDLLEIPAEAASYREDELVLAEQLIRQTARPFKHEKYRNLYREGLLNLISRKVRGEKIRALPKPKRATRSAELMDKLKASLNQLTEKPKKRTAA